MSFRPLPFTTPQHDRAAERRHDTAWLEQAWHDPGARAIEVDGPRVLVDPSSGQVQWRRPTQTTAGDRYLLGADDQGHPVFAVHRGDLSQDLSLGLRELAVSAPTSDLAWVVHAVALSQWHDTHRFCPRCGAATEVAAGGAERRCPADGSAHFPRVDPAVIVLVTDEHDRALLGHQAAWPDGRYSTLAGFVEPGESAEQAVIREVAEEASVTVGEVRLLATQPWPFPSSLMVGASAVAAGSPAPKADGLELADVRWFSRDELRASVIDGTVQVPGTISISRWLIERWFGAALPDDEAGWR